MTAIDEACQDTLREGAAPEYPVLRRLVESVPEAAVEGVKLYAIFHLLHTSVGFFKEIAARYHVQAIVAVPYSVDEDCVRKLRAMGINVIVPRSIDEVAGALLSEIRRTAGMDPFLIMEVGGYCAEAVNELRQRYPSFLGVVEDTNQGHWRYERLEKLDTPVFSIARSPVKQLENRLIGKAIVFSLEARLRELFSWTLCGKRVGVLGYGQIGKSVARSLKGRDAIVGIWDKDPVKRLEARLDGHEVAPRDRLLQEVDLLVGVSGKRSVTPEDFRLLKDGVILASGSSKDVEFGIGELHPHSTIDQNKTALLELHGRRYRVLNAGMPINFEDGSVLDSILDLIFSELFMCAMEVSRECRPNGLHMLDVRCHDSICEIWERVYGEGVQPT